MRNVGVRGMTHAEAGDAAKLSIVNAIIALPGCLAALWAARPRPKTGLPIVIDEVQRLPQVTLALKRMVDRDRRPR